MQKEDESRVSGNPSRVSSKTKYDTHVRPGPCVLGGGRKKELLAPEAVIQMPRPQPRVALTLMYCRSMSARTLKSETYWPKTELPNWLLLPVKGAALERSVRSG